MSTSPTLPPCPFCGNRCLFLRAFHAQKDPDDHSIAIACDECGAQGPQIYAPDDLPQEVVDDLIAAAWGEWNKRTEQVSEGASK